MIRFEQSIPICAALSAAGGILEVIATAILAYPAARSAQGIVWTDAQLKGCLAANILFQIMASIAGNLFATWFGPVAIVGPIFFAAQLLANLVIFWIVLGLEAFSQAMQIGTYVIVVAVVLLIVNGPEVQEYDDTTFDDLISEIFARVWVCILAGAMLASGFILTFLDLKKQQEWMKMAVLLVARSTAFSLNLTTGKAISLERSDMWLIISVAVKVISGMIYTKAIVVQATAVQQRVFVPVNAATIMFVNAVTGIIIWEDDEVVSSWVGYTCVFLLLALGCGLLLSDLRPLKEASPTTFLPRVAIVKRSSRQEILQSIKNFGKDASDERRKHGSKLEIIEDTIEEEDDEEDIERSNFRRVTMAGIEPSRRIQPSERSRSAAAATNTPRAARRSTFGSFFNAERTAAGTKAWLSVYEGVGAAPRASARMSAMVSHNSPAQHSTRPGAIGGLSTLDEERDSSLKSLKSLKGSSLFLKDPSELSLQESCQIAIQGLDISDRN